MLQNVGKNLVLSKHGLLSTIGYKLGPNEPTFYALEVIELIFFYFIYAFGILFYYLLKLITQK